MILTPLAYSLTAKRLRNSHCTLPHPTPNKERSRFLHPLLEKHARTFST
ncbi:hypothetical protein [Microcoleus sp. FACHB-831]|nr:hypothetical protein [Microcoleus sp. FACHB-831]